MIDDEIVQKCFAELTDDHTELWSFVYEVIRVYPLLTLEELIDKTVLLVNSLINKYRVVMISDYHITLFEVNNDPLIGLSKFQVLKYLREFMVKLNRVPDLGDGPWFTLL